MIWNVFMIGVLATALSDLWQYAYLRLSDGSRPHWGKVGRWVVGICKGRVVDPQIGKRPSVAYENAIGWAFHYLVGVSYAALYLLILTACEIDSGLLPALVFGLSTMAAPLFFMKPAMGGGLCGWRAPDPWRGFRKTLSVHLSFGFSLWLLSSLL